MAKGYRKAFGKWGEEQAVIFLSSQGYKILERNFRIGHSEVDVIAEKEGVTSFVEVKTRKDQEFGLAEYAFTPAKLAALERAVYGYFEQNPSRQASWKIDLLVVERIQGHDAPNFLYYENLSEGLA